MENKERAYELRSEKVRSIVGQIPSALVRYGTITLFAVLLVLFGIAYYMPYKQVYSGSITFYGVSEPITTAYISFDNDKILTNINEPIPLSIHLDSHDLIVQLTGIQSKRDTLNRYLANIELPRDGKIEFPDIQESSFDFSMVEKKSNLLGSLIPIFEGI